MLYEDGRPYTVPDSLEELTGPTSGVVELPQRLDWPEQGRYDLSDPRQRNLMYERVPCPLKRFLEEHWAGSLNTWSPAFRGGRWSWL